MLRRLLLVLGELLPGQAAHWRRDTRDTRDSRDSREEDTERGEKQRGRDEMSELQEPTLEERRRSSINIYQGQSKPLSHTALQV